MHTNDGWNADFSSIPHSDRTQVRIKSFLIQIYLCNSNKSQQIMALCKSLIKPFVNTNRSTPVSYCNTIDAAGKSSSAELASRCLFAS